LRTIKAQQISPLGHARFDGGKPFQMVNALIEAR
jgi:hypothetical protein